MKEKYREVVYFTKLSFDISISSKYRWQRTLIFSIDISKLLKYRCIVGMVSHEERYSHIR